MKSFLFAVLMSSFFVSKAQQADYVDFKHIEAMIFNLENSEVVGNAAITFEILKDTDSVFIDAKNFNQIECLLDGKNFHEYDGKHFIIRKNFAKGKQYTANISWQTQPKKALYFINKNSDSINQIWTQGQGKYTSNWLPSIDDVTDKIEFDLKIQFKKPYTVIANGKFIDLERLDQSDYYVWHYDMQKPMSSYLVALAIGKYDMRQETSKSGIPLELYYYPEDSLKVESTYRYTKQMFDFLEEEIGVPYPWQNYKQVPVHDFLYAGMENTSLTIFSDTFMVDDIGFNDKNYVNVNAHELAHQWFGDLVTAKSGEHHWLQEGFATYYALLAERQIFGNDYYFWRLLTYMQELEAQQINKQHTALINPKSSSTTFYKKGALLLHLLRDKIGDNAFKNAVKSYLNAYAYSSATSQDFINEVKKFSAENLDNFFSYWLESKTLDFEALYNYFKNESLLINGYLKIGCEAYTTKCSNYLNTWLADEIKVKIAQQIPKYIKKEDFKNSLKVRQAICKSINRIPLELKEDYESLLNDKSYITIENALFKLWDNFPNDRHFYLNKTKDIEGFNNKNIRTLWLTLALLTDDYEPSNDKLYFSELEKYTLPRYHFEIRKNAFEYLAWIRSCGEICINNLEQATKHHNWRFSKFAKNLLDQINQH